MLQPAETTDSPATLVPAAASPGVTAVDEGAGILTGWLEKRADWKMSWNKRFFSLKGSSLSYRESPSHRSDKNCIYLSGLERIADDPTSFRVQHEGGGWWLLKAASSADCDAWTNAIDAVLQSSTRSHVVVSGIVEKRSDWIHQWRTRYIVVHGCELAYSETENGPVKNRYILVAADLNPHSPNELRLACSNGEAFMIRLPTASEADTWASLLRHALRPSMTWRWQAVAARAMDDAATLPLLRASNHGAAMSEAGNILLFGGTTTADNGSLELHKELVCFEPACEHRCYVVDVEPFAEGVGARVRPAAREAHAMATLNGRLYMHGGCDKTTVMSDLWMLNLRSTTPTWVRLTLNRSGAEMLIPGLCGHTMTAQPEASRLIVIGGLDAGGVTSAAAAAYTPSLHSIETLGSLTQPRCRHGTAVLSDGHMLVVGGLRSRSNSDVHTTIEIYSPRRGRWREARTAGSLPAMISPAVATMGTGLFAYGSDGHEPARLHYIHYQQDTATVVVRELPNLGCPPKLHYGMSAHVAAGGAFLYVIGDSSTSDRGNAVHRVMLPGPDTPDRTSAEGSRGLLASTRRGEE